MDPEKFGLSGRTELFEISGRHIAIVKERKSRIIMKDGLRILEQAETIRNAVPGTKVSLMTGAPVCGKTRIFLNGKGIDILPLT